MKDILDKYGLAITNTEELKDFFKKIEEDQEIDERFYHWDKKVYVNVRDNTVGISL